MSGIPPPSLTADQVRQIVATATQMKNEGATEQTHPEYAKLIHLLRYHQYVTKNAQTNASAASPAPSPSATGTLPASAPPASAAPGQQATAFTQEQLTALKLQIYAYQLLSKNQSVPEDLKTALFDPAAFNKKANEVLPAATSQTVVPQTLVESALAEPSAIPPALDQEKVEVKPEPQVPTAPASQATLPKTISAAAHALRQQRILLPAATPVGADPYTMMHNREMMIKTRISYRIKELEEISSNLSHNSATDVSADEYNLKLKATIELKALKLLDRQKELREKILSGVSKATTLATAVDRTAYRRVKKQSLREARQTEKLERNQRHEREKKEKQKHIDYLNSILAHGRELMSFHKTQQNKLVRIGQAVLRFHNNAEKEEQKRLQRISQERLKALKADDEEAYLKLLDQAKDTRITHILEQTNSYLANLTNAVITQKKSVAPGEVTEEIENEETITRDYYNTAHKIDEDVIEQPKMLQGGQLKEYQIKGLQWMVSLYNNRLNGILADEMGLGKTIQTISLITYLIEKKRQNGPFLIIVPLSTITNWAMEFEKWAPNVVKVVFKGSPNERRVAAGQIRQGNFHVLLTTYEYIIKERPLLSKIKWIHMIIDEGHRMKNANSKLSTTLMQYYSSRYRLILTGTPLQNNLPELWALLNFVLPKIFNSVKSFDEWFNSPFATAGTGQDRVELSEEESLLIIRRLHKVLRPFLLRRLKKDVESELPDKVETVIKCKMSALQLRLYEQIRARRSVFAEDGAKMKGIRTLNNMVMQFRKICNHPFVFEEVENAINPEHITDDRIWRTAGKFEFLDRVLPKFFRTGHRVLMFFQMTQIMDIMEDFLRFRGHAYLRLDGSTKAEDRSELLKLFNAPQSPYNIFLLSTRAGGLGLNLQTADTVIIFDSDWNPHQDLQAQDRAHRIGQTKEVRILRLITSKSVEETILARAQYKLDIDGKVIQAGKFDNKTSEAEREELLRTLFGSGEGDDDKDNDEEEGEIDEDELNEIISRNDEELVLFKKMDEDMARERSQRWRAAGNPGDPPPRLMQDNELPPVYLEDPYEAKQSVDELAFGRGSRNRKEVAYDDGLNDDQWLDALEEGNLDTVIQKRRARIEKRRKKAVGETSEFSDTEGASPDQSLVIDEARAAKKRRPEGEEGAPPKKKRGRQSKRPPTPDYVGIDESTVEVLPEPVRKSLIRGFMACFTAVEDLEVDLGEYSRQRCVLFVTLPDRTDYPDYYQIIRTPIAMDIIKTRIFSPYYKSPADFHRDFTLMFNNARTYNVEGSEVYDDANEMEKVFNATYDKEFPGGRMPEGVEEVLGTRAKD